MNPLSAAPYFEQIHGLYANVKAAYDHLRDTQTKLDRQISDFYHDLERYDLDGQAGYVAATMLQTTLRKRRAVKDELLKITPIYHALNDNIARMDTRYRRANSNSVKIRRSLNVKLTIDDFQDI